MSNGYYRPNDTNPRWTESWSEQIEEGITPEEVLDQLCEFACGIKPYGASDICMKYAKHIHAHIIAAYEVGLFVGKRGE